MKHIYILTVILLISSLNLNAQITVVVKPANGGPTEFAFIGNDLYYT